MVTLGLLALPRIPGASIVDFVGANPAQRKECRDAQRGRTKEYSALRKILTGQSHQACGYGVARRIESIVASGPHGHCSPTDETETNSSNRGRDYTRGEPVQDLSNEYESNARHQGKNQG